MITEEPKIRDRELDSNFFVHVTSEYYTVQ